VTSRTLGFFFAAAALAASPPALADTVGLIGADYSSVEGQVTKGVLGAAVLGFQSGGFLTAAGTRYDDNLIGDGFSVTAGVGAPIGGGILARVFGTRWIGANEFRAWRVKGGPFKRWDSGTYVGLSFVRHEQDDGATATGGIVEASVPVAARWRAVVSGSAASLGSGGESVSGSAGMAWQAASRLEVQAEAGVSRNGALGTTTTSGSSGGGGGPLSGLPLIGRGPDRTAEQATTESRNLSGTVTMGIRVLFP
jgi:hypothetical protein